MSFKHSGTGLSDSLKETTSIVLSGIRGVSPPTTKRKSFGDTAKAMPEQKRKVEAAMKSMFIPTNFISLLRQLCEIAALITPLSSELSEADAN